MTVGTFLLNMGWNGYCSIYRACSIYCIMAWVFAFGVNMRE